MPLFNQAAVMDKPVPNYILYGMALVCGCVLPLSLAPFDIWFMALLSFVGLYLIFELSGNKAEQKQVSAFRTGWFFGLGKYGVGASWVYVSIHEHGNAAPWLAVLLVILFVAGLAMFEALWAGLYFKLLRVQKKPLFSPLAFAASRTVLEWSLTWILSGFPWLFVGYSQLDAPAVFSLAGWAPVAGVLGLGFVLMLSAAFFARFIIGFYSGYGVLRRGFCLAMVLIPWAMAYLLSQANWVQRGEQYSVALVQGNVDQSTKWQQQSVLPIIRNYQNLSEPYYDVDLLLWPEAAITLFHHQAGAVLAQITDRLHGSLVLGIPAIEVQTDGRQTYQNTALVIGSGEGQYVKRQLVPFGEYVPLASLLRGLIQFFDLPMSYAEPGNDIQPLLRAGGLKMAMAICYEIAYPELVRREGREADVLLTISNDTWFGSSIGPHQHFQMARMRALELGRFLLRATNNGLTAIVDERGRTVEVLPQFEAGVLSGHFYALKGHTPYARYGDMPLGLLILLIILLALFFKLRGENQSS